MSKNCMSYSQVNLLRGMDFKLRTSSSFTGTRNLADMYVKVNITHFLILPAIFYGVLLFL